MSMSHTRFAFVFLVDVFFFFSSRRRHTRFDCDWSSDVCSSDLDPILLIGAAILGLCFGSFVNVCILRLANEDKKQRSLCHPPSTCPSCGQPIAWRDNIPIVSWLLLRGRCRRCGHPISLQYPIIEAVVGVLWIAAMVAYGPTVHFLAAALVASILLGIALSHARHYLIPHEYNWAGLIIGLGASLTAGVRSVEGAGLGAARGVAPPVTGGVGGVL